MRKEEIYIELLRSLIPAARSLVTFLDFCDVKSDNSKNEQIKDSVFEALQLAHHIPGLLRNKEDEFSQADVFFIEGACQRFLDSDVPREVLPPRAFVLIENLNRLYKDKNKKGSF